jgi:hypothetical protein
LTYLILFVIVLSDSMNVELGQSAQATPMEAPMSSDFDVYQATVDLSKAEAWEAHAIHSFFREDRRDVSITGRFMVFRFTDCDNSLLWRLDEPVLWDVYRETCLEDVLLKIHAKGALSLTFDHRWNTSGGWEEDDWVVSLQNYEKLAEHMPTLVLQEVLARRLE